jgi:hypothetical protein
MLLEGTMTARKPTKPSPGRKLACRRDSGLPTNRWEVIGYAMSDTGPLIRLCVLVVVVGTVLVVGAMLAGPHILRFWM